MLQRFFSCFPYFFPAGAIFLGPAPGRSRIPEMPTVPKMDLQAMEDGSETENREAEKNEYVKYTYKSTMLLPIYNHIYIYIYVYIIL